MVDTESTLDSGHGAQVHALGLHDEREDSKEV